MKAERYWRKMLKGVTIPTPLMVDKSSSSLSAERTHARHEVNLSEANTAKLRSFVRGNKLSFEVLVQGVWGLLLSRYSGEEDVLFGVKSETNISPVRVKVAAKTPVLVWLKQFHDQQIEDVQAKGFSLNEIRSWSEIPSDLPFFESLVSFGNLGEDDGSKFPLILTALLNSDLTLKIDYHENRFDGSAIVRMLGHLQTLLVGIIDNAEQPISSLPLLTDAELHQAQVDWNDTLVDYPEDKCLHELFEAKVEFAPDKVAVMFEEKQMTYRELNQRANQLAHYLQRLGVGPDIVVGMFMERSLEMVVGLYGILKAGGAYVPLDPSYPKDRLAFMVEDTQVPVLLTRQDLVARLPEHKAKTVVIDSEWEKISRESAENPKSGVTPEHLAYVIYTSGSTGRPKGAVLNHRGRVNNFCDFNRRYSVGSGDKVLGLASLSFDMHAYDNFGLMAAGGANVILESSAILEPARWAELIIQHEITVWHSVPALLEMYVNYISERPELWPKSLRLVLLGGDWIPVNLPDRLKSMVADVHVVSMGGATECSMDSTIYDIEEPSSAWKSIPYGVPMANQLSYVLDPNFNLLPIGVPGELYLGGVGVGRGYLNRPQLTAQKFVPNPFCSIPGDRMYRTGDLACYMPDGNLELLGRIDFQVKIRGYRVELGEIISTLCQHTGVKEAIVVAKDVEEGVPAKGKQLVGYVVPEAELNGSVESVSKGQDDEQVSQWQRIYNETYTETSDTGDPTFNISTWNSSYTGLQIAEEEMREWANQSVDRILALKPKRVLEIACGTGLLLFRVAPHCEKYTGIDFSEAGLNYIRRQLEKPELRMPQVSLIQRMADNFEGSEANSVDVAILHSVVQLFPSIDYLVRVLEGAVNVVEPGGFIFVGDVISLPLMEAFHTSVQLYQAPSWASKDQLRQRIKKAGSNEEQMFVDPEFFLAFKQHLPKISHVEIQLRRGKHLNEMTRFRYDVVLHIESESKTIEEIQWLDWQGKELTVSSLRKFLEETGRDVIGVKNIPNRRLSSEMSAMQLLRSGEGSETAGEMRAALGKSQKNGFIDPEDIWALSDELNYDVLINWSGSAENFDEVLSRRTSSADLSPVQNEMINAKPWQEYANNPLQSSLAQKLVPELRNYLQETLPDYMVPSAFVLLDALPLSPNGKVDRRALPPPDQSRPELTADFVPPGTPVEEVVASIWAEVFEFETVGIYDNFLEMGGHSLLATQIMSRLQDVFPLKLPLRYVFASPTVAALTERIYEAGEDAQVDVVEVARALLQISRLSDAEVKSMLAGEANCI